jgi:hypothetical protein
VFPQNPKAKPGQKPATPPVTVLPDSVPQKAASLEDILKALRK